ncbi:MAG: peptide MFS transporter [Bacteroidetes bacterium]|nr:peptide MFS transporter [Bacteroidota bacterium]
MSQPNGGEKPVGNEEANEGTDLLSKASADAIALEAIHNFKGQYPKQLWLLFLTEMWERFCFYGMRGILTIFIGSEILNHLPESLADKTANLQYGAIQAFVYAFTFAGGLFADKILGFRKSLFWGGTLMVIGNFLIAANPHHFFYIGICFTIIGTGFFKPNISTMVGALYREGDPRRDSGFGLFYSGINVGAFLGGIVCVYIGKELHSWSGAFAAAGIVMVIGLLTFVFTQRTLGPIGISPLPAQMPKSQKRLREILVYAGSLAVIPLIWLMVKNTDYTDIFMYIVGPLTLLYLVYEMRRLNKVERQKMMAALVFIIFSILFWGIYEQAGGSLAIFALKNLQPNLLGMHIDPNMVNNSSNAIFVIALSPIVGLAWVALAKKKANPNTVVKFGLGFLFLAAAYYLYYYTRFFADSEGRTSLNLFTLAYLVITFGELCLSPIGLSIMTKLSPKPLWGVMMGMWFLASAYGQYVAGRIGASLAEVPEGASNLERLYNYTDGYRHLALYALIAGIVLILIAPFVRKLMHEVT